MSGEVSIEHPEIEIIEEAPLALADPNHPETQASMRTIRRRVEESSVPINRIVDQLVDKYAQDLTKAVERLKRMLRTPDKISDQEMEEFTLSVPVYLYFAASGLEALGVEGDTARAVKMELFNEVYTKTAGTIQDKTKRAELQTFPEYLIEIAFNRAYKKLNTQVKMAEHAFSGVKKVLSKRMLELEVLHRDGPPRRRPRHDED